jgi:hypothetical protein
MKTSHYNILYHRDVRNEVRATGISPQLGVTLICVQSDGCPVIRAKTCTGTVPNARVVYDGVSKSFRTGRLERELQMVQLSATRCSCIAILWLSLVSFAAITLCVASQRVFIVVSTYFVMDSVRKLLDTPSYASRLVLFLIAECFKRQGIAALHTRSLARCFLFFMLDTCQKFFSPAPCNHDGNIV